MGTFNNNPSVNNAKPIHILEYKYKNKYKKAVSFSLNMGVNHISFNGAEVDDDFTLTKFETQKDFQDFFDAQPEKYERIIPLANIVEIITRRIVSQ